MTAVSQSASLGAKNRLFHFPPLLKSLLRAATTTSIRSATREHTNKNTSRRNTTEKKNGPGHGVHFERPCALRCAQLEKSAFLARSARRKSKWTTQTGDLKVPRRPGGLSLTSFFLLWCRHVSRALIHSFFFASEKPKKEHMQSRRKQTHGVLLQVGFENPT